MIIDLSLFYKNSLFKNDSDQKQKLFPAKLREKIT